MAEKEGFEPSRPFRGLHDFQSCALDQLGDFSIVVELVLSVKEHWLLYHIFSQSQAPFSNFLRHLNHAVSGKKSIIISNNFNARPPLFFCRDDENAVCGIKLLY